MFLHCLRVKEAVQVDAETIDTMDLSMQVENIVISFLSGYYMTGALSGGIFKVEYRSRLSEEGNLVRISVLKRVLENRSHWPSSHKRSLMSMPCGSWRESSSDICDGIVTQLELKLALGRKRSQVWNREICSADSFRLIAVVMRIRGTKFLSWRDLCWISHPRLLSSLPHKVELLVDSPDDAEHRPLSNAEIFKSVPRLVVML